MARLCCVSQAALAAGVPARYLYWFGRSGRRYLFTCTEPGGVRDFAEGVAIVVAAGEIVWTGEVAALASPPRTARSHGTAVYIHFLAATADERNAVIEDLRPAAGAHVRLAA